VNLMVEVSKIHLSNLISESNKPREHLRSMDIYTRVNHTLTCKLLERLFPYVQHLQVRYEGNKVYLMLDVFSAT